MLWGKGANGKSVTVAPPEPSRIATAVGLDDGCSRRSGGRPSGAPEDRNVLWFYAINPDGTWRSLSRAAEDRNYWRQNNLPFQSDWRLPSGTTEICNMEVSTTPIRGHAWQSSSRTTEDRNFSSTTSWPPKPA